jgi:hypothetical protein
MNNTSNILNKINELNKKIEKITNEINIFKNEFNLITNELTNNEIHDKNNSNKKVIEYNNMDIKLIENKDLNSIQYDEKILRFNMERGTLTPYKVFSTQKNLSNEFIIEYILNEDYAVFLEDFDITINKVIGKFHNFVNFNPKTYK